jgi:glutamate dehydrogenase
MSQQRPLQSAPILADQLADQNLNNTARTADYLANESDLVQHYYSRVPFEDIADRDLDDLNKAALSHWNLAAVRQPDECIVRVYRPTVAEHGWTTTKTVIEIATSDKPFLVRSVALAITSTGYAIGQFIHPIFRVIRDAQGRLQGMSQSDAEDVAIESFMQVHINQAFDQQSAEILEAIIRNVINDVNLVCDDWEPMKAACLEASQHLRESDTDDFEVAEACDFIEWLQRFHFTFTGYCELTASNDQWRCIDDRSFGIFRHTDAFDIARYYLSVDDIARSSEQVLTVTKSLERAPILWPKPMDVITFNRHAGNKDIRCVITGFFTSRAVNSDLDTIPILRHKALTISANSGINPGAHDGKLMLSILENLPRDLLLQIPADGIHDIVRGIMDLEHHPRVRLFGVQDQFNRFATCFVYVPYELYSRELRERIQSILQSELQADNVEFAATFSSENSLARINFFLRTPNRPAIDNDFFRIEQLIVDAVQNWDENLELALCNTLGEQQGIALANQVIRGIPAGYKEFTDPVTAARDIGLVTQQVQSDGMQVLLYKKDSHTASETGFNIYHGDVALPLSNIINVLENMGLQVDGEVPFDLDVGGKAAKIRVFNLRHPGARDIPTEQIATNFQDAFQKIWQQEIEDDGMNQLVMAAGLTWRQTTILRTYCKYLMQINVPYSQTYMIDCLVKNPNIARLSVEMFETRFNTSATTNDTSELRDQFVALLDDVSSLDEDRILRAFENAIAATVRTNYYKRDASGSPLDYLSIKLVPSLIEGIPLPCPEFEIFVCSPRVEATHLRGGKVARGGLRWSDRREDFRTEVLGLMKAQMVKNSVIVPVGSKGGFVVKRPPAGGTRDELMAEVVLCYQTFLRGMLDITDNYVDGNIVAPADVVRHDEDDPYLVVAADKGTATFSDIANGVSDDYGFWLGDAFASGGSVGYDHKGMGITAKGAWESVKRHFRELNVDTQQEAFTVVGIGDMAGDVFGNGMLLSEHIQLVAAFNHMHIFLDPTPDAASSFAERKRLFNLPGCTWEDYDSALISTGGGIFSRSAKSVPLSSQVQQMIGTTETAMAPNTLIHHLLKSEVDLLWNGGIGTYIKASTESHLDAQDKSNDSLRVNGNELKCKVVGEGGNLGCTQLGRIEFAGNGGRMYTDAIDNSAGVDCSDHEVNIKILVDSLVATGVLPAARRTELLAEMTDNVSALVLRDNYLQTQCISLTLANASTQLEEHTRLIEYLEDTGRLNRAIEFLPDAEVIADRQNRGHGLTAPEIAVLVAYSKMDIYEKMLDSSLVEDSYFDSELLLYFPDQLSNGFAPQTLQHQLRKEIIATQVTNSLVNRLGPTFILQLQEELGGTVAEIATAYVAVKQLFNMRRLWASIEGLDNKIDNALQTELLLIVRGWVERGVHWLVKNRRCNNGVQAIVDHFDTGLQILINCVPASLAAPTRQSFDSRCARFEAEGVPSDIAVTVSSAFPLSTAFDILDIATTTSAADSCEVGVETIAAVYYELGEYLQIQWLREQIANLEVHNHWHSLAKSALRSDLHYRQRHLCAEILAQHDMADNTTGAEANASPAGLVEAWGNKSRSQLEVYMQRLQDLKSMGNADYAMLSLAVAEVTKLLQSDRPLAGTDE